MSLSTGIVRVLRTVPRAHVPYPLSVGQPESTGKTTPVTRRGLGRKPSGEGLF
jgi:hypothetical protein